MAVTATPIFTQTPQDKVVVTTGSATDAPYAPTTQLTTVVTAGANGAKLYRLVFIPAATVTAQVVSVVLQTAASGTKVVLDTILIAAYSSSTTSPPPVIVRDYDNVILKAASIIQVAQSVTTGAVSVCGFWGDY
jgi:hypothetical protein